MTAPKPSDLAFIRFVSVENMMRLVNSIGVETAPIETNIRFGDGPINPG